MPTSHWLLAIIIPNKLLQYNSQQQTDHGETFKKQVDA